MQASGWESQAERGMEEGGQEEVSSFLEPLGLRHKQSREGWGAVICPATASPFPLQSSEPWRRELDNHGHGSSGSGYACRYLGSPTVVPQIPRL